MQEEKLGIKLTIMQEKKIEWYIGKLNVKFLDNPPETDYYGYTIPNCNKIPDGVIVGDGVYVDWNSKLTIEEVAKIRGVMLGDIPEKRPCNCPMNVLMTKGCQCGGI